MTVIRIEPGQVSNVGSQFLSKSSELEGLVAQARSLMSSLEGQFTGQRATRIFQEWEQMQPSLTSAIQALQQAGNLLQRAATSFESTDSGL
jgi:WXG100 family type VII secretion target